jgi:hypothetical protein
MALPALLDGFIQDRVRMRGRERRMVGDRMAIVVSNRLF